MSFWLLAIGSLPVSWFESAWLEPIDRKQAYYETEKLFFGNA
jgi:hypothetical protein